jgi:hypothetical protein
MVGRPIEAEFLPKKGLAVRDAGVMPEVRELSSSRSARSVSISIG